MIYIIKCTLDGGPGPLLNNCYYKTIEAAQRAIDKFTKPGVCSDKVWEFNIWDLQSETERKRAPKCDGCNNTMKKSKLGYLCTTCHVDHYWDPED